MGQTVLEILMAPVLVALATLAGRRWGARAGGLVSAFPAVVGPVLLIIAQQRGGLAAERAASATLLGLVALSGFALAYARAARGRRWPGSLAAGWACAIAAAAIAGWWLADAALPVALTAAVLSIAFARGALPRSPGQPYLGGSAKHPRGDVVVRMALTAALIALLTVASELFGPVVGGMLAALPVLASVLAVFTHRVHGSEATIGLLGGMLTGMSGFVVFCAAIALLAAPAGTVVAFAVATVCAVAAQALMLIVISAVRFLPAPRLPGG
ncbi:MAG TPA: hypothetical protein VFI54_13315 [Solirubrobacteraceae bacterium]|nr:hypothetical protein [Solirubrobacteraceae bacterium]